MGKIAFLVGALALGIAAAPATAGPNLVKNGGFETTTLTGSSQFSDYFIGNPVSDWTTSGYNMIFFAGTATTSGANTQYGPGLTFHGPANGTSNGYTDSPTGGNYVGADGAFITAPIQQTITGLEVGKRFLVDFDWSAAQQTGFDGPTTEQWTVSLGGESYSTPVWNNPDHGFKPWSHQTFSFTATAATQVLSFLAVGTPEGRPPFSLLDGVSGATVPEPATWAMMLGGFAFIGAALRSRRRDVIAA